MLNAGIIARVSTDQQNDKGSLDIQIDKNLKYCNANNINPVRIYKQVISGGNGEVLKTEVRNDIYKYTLSIKNKLIKDSNKYTEQDYIDLMNIIEFHEMKIRSLNN